MNHSDLDRSLEVNVQGYGIFCVYFFAILKMKFDSGELFHLFTYFHLTGFFSMLAQIGYTIHT